MDLLTLEIDPEFKNLIPSLKRSEYLQLESNLMTDGCREAIITWNGIIVDGHNRYEICHRHGIPFRIQEKEFDCRESVITWICANQLGRRNISDEYRKYLIGTQYNNEKVVASKRNPRGVNQYTVAKNHDENGNLSTKIQLTADRIAEENHISRGTVQKYACYARAVDEIGKHEPKLYTKLLSGNYKVAHNNVLGMAKQSPEEIRKINRRIDRNNAPFVQFKKGRSAIVGERAEPETEDNLQGPSVKDMPAFDPDAEVSSLTLTIPSWSSSIERTRNNANLLIVSAEAKERLIAALNALLDSISRMITAIEEETK